MSGHIFLTGEIQVGKSTILRKVVERLCISPAGFRTVWGGADGEGLDRLYLLPFGVELGQVCLPQFDDDLGQDDSSVAVADVGHVNSCAAVAALRDVNTRRFEKRPEVFDDIGVRILSDVGATMRAGLIVMDELGFIEDSATMFQSAVYDCLDGQVSVVGVIKPRRTPFLDAVRAHSRVRIFEVTPENRDELVDVVADLLSGHK